MRKEKFGTREVIIIVASIIVYLALGYVQNYILEMNSLGVSILFYIRIMLLTVVASTFGHIVVVLNVIGAFLLEGFINAGEVDIFSVIIWTVYCGVMGRYSHRFRVLQGEFKGILILDYLVVCVVANAATFVLIAPLLSFLVFNGDLPLTIEKMKNLAICNICVSGIGGTIILYLISFIISKRSTKNNKNSRE